MIPEEQFRGIVQLLQQDPATYRAFGVYWWPLKRMLKEHYDTETLYFLGGVDDPEVRELVETHWKHDDRTLFRAAMNHFREKTLWGERYDGLSSLPTDGAPYMLEDLDMGPANAVS